MSKNRVFGEQVLVRLYNSEKNLPIVVDFDSIEVKLLTIAEESNRRSIGKSASTHQMQFAGWQITLSRQKRDNYIDAFISILEKLSLNKRQYSELTVQKITKHTYASSATDLESEFLLVNGQNNSGNYTSQQRLNNAVAGLTSQAINTATNRVGQGLASITNNPTARDLANNALNTANNVTEQLLNGNLNIFSNIDFTQLYLNPLKESIVYFDCSLADYNSLDKAKSESEQTLVLKSTYSENFTDDNQYTDYITRVLTANYLKQQAQNFEKYSQYIEQNDLNMQVLGLNVNSIVNDDVAPPLNNKYVNYHKVLGC